MLTLPEFDVNSEPIPKSVATFIAEHIDSLVELEALLLLYAHRDRLWPASEIARELRIDRAWPRKTELQGLCNKGILRCTPGPEHTYQFVPRNPEIESTVTQLAGLYPERRVTIIGLIFSKPVERLQKLRRRFSYPQGSPEMGELVYILCALTCLSLCRAARPRLFSFP